MLDAVRGLIPLCRAILDLKRLRVARAGGSLAECTFLRAWGELLRGEVASCIAERQTAHAVVATLLGGIDGSVLADGGIAPDSRLEILQRAFDEAASPIPATARATLREALSADAPSSLPVPSFVQRLVEQPRAGATRPGHGRIVLEPAESHAEHCASVAVLAVIFAPVYGADPALPFLAGLAHHLHNAWLPDAGDAGDAVLDPHLPAIRERFRERALGEIPEPLRSRVRAALQLVYRSDSPEARAFQTADVLDRVLEMEWHARTSAFTLDVALQEMDIVHPGPVQAFQLEVIRASTLR